MLKPIKTKEEFLEVLRNAEREHKQRDTIKVSLEILEKYWPKVKEK